MKFSKQVKTEIKKEVFYLEGNIDIDSNYFIKKIEEGVINSSNNFKTNVHGFMTSWDYFSKDEKFLDVFLNIMSQFEQYSCINVDLPKWNLGESWGIKEEKGGFTKRHNHKPAILSGIIYLNDVKQKLIFDEINVELSPEKGKYAVFSGDLNHNAERNLEEKIKYGISFNLYEINKT
jgi:hypothetical protein